MKKFTCFIIAILLVASVAVLPAYAVETEESTMLQRSNAAAYAEKLAVRAFPEYADRITADVVDFSAITTYRMNNEDSVVVQETRAISEKEVITYTEYASGLAYVTGLFTPGKNVTNTAKGDTYTTYTLNAWMKCMGSDNLLMAEDVKLRVNSDGTNKLESEGHASVLSDVGTPMAWDRKKEGDRSNSAYVTYTGIFTITVSIPGGEGVTPLNGYLKVFIDGTEPAVASVDSDSTQ